MGRQEYTALLGIAMLTGVLFAGSVVLFSRRKSVSVLLQLFGAGCLVLAVITHISATFHLFPWMHWGLERSVGHYLDLGSATVGLILFPLGYLCHAIAKQSP